MLPKLEMQILKPKATGGVWRAIEREVEGKVEHKRGGRIEEKSREGHGRKKILVKGQDKQNQTKSTCGFRIRFVKIKRGEISSSSELCEQNK